MWTSEGNMHVLWVSMSWGHRIKRRGRWGPLVWTWGKETLGCVCCSGCNLVEPKVSWYEINWQEFQHMQITNWQNHKNEVARPNTPKSEPKPNSTSLIHTLAEFFCVFVFVSFFFFNLPKAKFSTLLNSFFWYLAKYIYIFFY